MSVNESAEHAHFWPILVILGCFGLILAEIGHFLGVLTSFMLQYVSTYVLRVSPV